MPIKKVVSENKVPIKIWAESIEEGALKQASNLANLPFIFKHVALMPDTHEGFGMPIGGVIALKGNVIPNAVGVDIGCGMLAAKYTLTKRDCTKDKLEKLMESIYRAVPVGFSKHRKPISDADELEFEDYLSCPVIRAEKEAALHQLGSLGGGNHFIELQSDALGNIWLMIHSGSRNVGLKIAEYYNKLAIKLNKQWSSEVPAKWSLAHLPYESDECQSYLKSMDFALKFAHLNREAMFKLIDREIKYYFGDCGILEKYNVHHNYAALEHHFNENVYIHRKGAIRARDGEIGIIPGSMGTKSYITIGLGNSESFYSSSHGSGRLMSRSKAKQVISIKESEKRMGGIVHKPFTKDSLDEAPDAYKNIKDVMKNQTDLVIIKETLIPILSVKG